MRNPYAWTNTGKQKPEQSGKPRQKTAVVCELLGEESGTGFANRLLKVFAATSLKNKLETNLVSPQEGVRSPELLESPRTLPSRSPNFPRSSPVTSPEVLSVWNLTAIQRFPGRFPRLPRKFSGLSQKFTRLPQRSAPFSGKPDIERLTTAPMLTKLFPSRSYNPKFPILSGIRPASCNGIPFKFRVSREFFRYPTCFYKNGNGIYFRNRTLSEFSRHPATESDSLV